MKKKLLTILLVVLPIGVFAQTYEEQRKADSLAFEIYKQQAKEGILASKKEYEDYRKRELEAYENYKKEMTELWGDYKDRTKKDWVEYKENGRTRTAVDFEQGTARVEIIVDSKEDVEKAKAQMKETLVKTFDDKGTDREFPMPEVKPKSDGPDIYNPGDMPTYEPPTPKKDTKAKPEPEKEKTPKPEPKPALEKPVLTNQLPDNATTPKEKEALAEKISKENVKTKQVKGADGKERTVVYVDFDLAKNHVEKRAKEFQEVAHKFAEEYDLSPALVFAIMHTESHFNPLAKSPANAYGLMQVVPTSAGRDAYNRLYKKDGVPTPEYLFKPDKNVQMGSVYLRILASGSFRKVEDPQTREYMIICAYNTGAGNVSKAYIGSFKIGKAIPKINAKTPEENYQFLLENLPYEETRSYLKKVSDRKKIYESWYKEK